jgi:hypothetical protein
MEWDIEFNPGWYFEVQLQSRIEVERHFCQDKNCEYSTTIIPNGWKYEEWNRKR